MIRDSWDNHGVVISPIGAVLLSFDLNRDPYHMVRLLCAPNLLHGTRASRGQWHHVVAIFPMVRRTICISRPSRPVS